MQTIQKNLDSKSHAQSVPRSQPAGSKHRQQGAQGLKYALPFQVGVGIVTPKALRMLTHVATLWTGLRRRNQPREEPFLSSYRSLKQKYRGLWVKQRKWLPEGRTDWTLTYLCSTSRCSRKYSGLSHRRHSHSLFEQKHRFIKKTHTQ